MNYYEKGFIENIGGIIYDYVEKGIESLSKFYRIFIVSNCDDWYLDAFIKHSKLSLYITGSDCFGKSNLSKAEMIKKLVEKHNLQNAVYIGDTISDKEASDEADIDFIFAAYGFGKLNTDCTKVSSFKEFTAFY